MELGILFLRVKRVVIGRVTRGLFLAASGIGVVDRGPWPRSEQI